MFHHPAEIEVTRQDGRKEFLDIVPVYRTEGEAYVATGAFRIYEDLAAHEEEGTNHPGFLGELHFHGQSAFEWKYLGDCLTETEVFQILVPLQESQPLFLLGNDPDNPLSFTYHRLNSSSYIQIVADDGSFLVFINGSYGAKIEPAANDWAITTIDVLGRDLENELIKRIREYRADR